MVAVTLRIYVQNIQKKRKDRPKGTPKITLTHTGTEMQVCVFSLFLPYVYDACKKRIIPIKNRAKSKITKVKDITSKSDTIYL